MIYKYKLCLLLRNLTNACGCIGLYYLKKNIVGVNSTKDILLVMESYRWTIFG